MPVAFGGWGLELWREPPGWTEKDRGEWWMRRGELGCQGCEWEGKPHRLGAEGGSSIAAQLLASRFCRPTLREARELPDETTMSFQSCLWSHVLQKPGSWS